VREIDYLIADPWVPPHAAEACFTEKIQRMPETYVCFTPPTFDLQQGPLPALTALRITFGSFNNLLKLNDAVVALWARVLHAVPQSRLYLKTRQLTPSKAKQQTIERFGKHGIDASRLILEGHAPRHELLAAYRNVDIALDPFPFPGGTTSVECLWMGVPVLTLVGDCYLSHIGESILQNAGLADWIARSPDEYVSKAVSHAGNLQRLATLRDKLRTQVLESPLFDAPRFALNFEATLREMWVKWCVDQSQISS
jgi:predicted O-linked N-acetylglucosamine transferase (SPINDLY family)